MADVQTAPPTDAVNGAPDAAAAAAAPEVTTNGNASAPPTELSPAAALALKHAEAAHNVAVEDTVDEDEIAHPGSKSAIATGQATPLIEPIDPSADSATPSVAAIVAAGKAAAASAGKKQPQPKQQPIDIHSAEAFPSLGPAKAPRPAVAPPASMWGAARPNGAGGGSKPAFGASFQEILTLAPEQCTPKEQLPKPINEICADLQRTLGVNIAMSSSSNGVRTFIIKGNDKMKVSMASRKIQSKLALKVTMRVSIPANTRKFIIGAKGAKIKEIQERTETKITVPSVEEVPPQVSDDPFAEDETMIDVTIEGDPAGAAAAKAEIDSIVNARTSHVNLRLPPNKFPGQFYPFLAGPHNKHVQDLEEGKDLKIKIPPYIYSNSSTTFTPAEHPITLHGEKNAVHEARAELERRIEELQKDFQSITIDVAKPKHRFVVGNHGSGIHEIMAESGCSVVLPPQHVVTDKVMIVGPTTSIGAGVTAVMKVANSMHIDSIDIARAHRTGAAEYDPRAHARDLARYFRKRREMQRLETEHQVNISYPRDEALFNFENPAVLFEIFGKEKDNVATARKQIINLVNMHPPHRLAYVEIDPLHHKHIIGAKGKNLQKIKEDHHVDLLFADEDEQDPQVVLIYEGPEGILAQFEADAAKEALEKVKAELQKAAEEQADLKTKVLNIPNKYHSFIVGKNGTTLNTFPGYADGTIHIIVGAPKRKPGQAPLNPAQQEAADNSVTIRGPSAAVDRAAKEINDFVEAHKHEEVMSSYTTTFDFPQKFSRNLVGKGGQNISKLREELGVSIDIQDDKATKGATNVVVEIKGHKRNVEVAKQRVLSMAKKLEDDTTISLNVAPEYHRSIIGTGGKFVKRLEDKYSVRINFPKQHKESAGADDGSDTGVPARNQAPDEVVIRGPSKGVRDAKEEIMDLLKYEVEHSHSAVIKVPAKVLPHIIGGGGKSINAIRQDSGAKIELPERGSSSGGDEEVEIKIKGTKTQVDKAKKALLDSSKELGSIVTRTLDIDKKYHRTLIGTGGSNLRNMVIEAGGPDDRAAQARMVRFPNQDSSDNTIKVEGNAKVVDKLVALIEKIVERESNKITIVVDVPTDKHRKIIGREGNVRREIEAKFNVTVDVPRQRQGQSVSSEVKVTGKEEDVEKAKEHILELTKDQEGVTVNVPRNLHHAVADGGAYIRKLRNDFHVTVDHGGVQLPPKPPKAAGGARKRVNAAELPLITDDPSESPERSVSWEVVEDEDGSSEAGGEDIPWILRANKSEDIAKAKADLEKVISQSAEHRVTGYLILPDPSKYRYVVGAGGSNVNRIRKETGCRVTIPKDQADGEAIVVRGSKDGVEKAKEIILELVKGGGEGNGGRRRRGGNHE